VSWATAVGRSGFRASRRPVNSLIGQSTLAAPPILLPARGEAGARAWAKTRSSGPSMPSRLPGDRTGERPTNDGNRCQMGSFPASGLDQSPEADLPPRRLQAVFQLFPASFTLFVRLRRPAPRSKEGSAEQDVRPAFSGGAPLPAHLPPAEEAGVRPGPPGGETAPMARHDRGGRSSPSSSTAARGRPTVAAAPRDPRHDPRCVSGRSDGPCLTRGDDWRPSKMACGWPARLARRSHRHPRASRSTQRASDRHTAFSGCRN
jgi:hypothetical protein